MNPFLSRISHGASSSVLPLAAFAVILGVMVRMAWITESSRTIRIGALDPAQQAAIKGGTIDMIADFKRLNEEVTRLRKQNTELQNAMGTQSSESSTLNNMLQEAKAFAGMTPVEGPGVIVQLIDSRPIEGSAFSGPDQVVHDTDVLRVTNEMWASGAEAISVNNHRISVVSSIRCVGPVIHIDRVPIASPIIIRAVGDTETMFGGLNLPGGVLDEIRQTDPKMVRIEKADKLALPPYMGSTAHKIAKTVVKNQ